MRIAIAIVCAVVLAAPAYADWSEQQAAVWSVVEASWVDDAEETGKWPSSYAVDAYSSWGETDAYPDNLKAAVASVRFGDESGKTLFYQIEPATISIDGDTAVVNYFATVVSENYEGKREREVSAISEVLVRRDGAWRYMASSGWTPDLD